MPVRASRTTRTWRRAHADGVDAEGALRRTTAAWEAALRRAETVAGSGEASGADPAPGAASA